MAQGIPGLPPQAGRSVLTPLEVPFGKLDTKTDPAMLQPGALTVAENVSVQTNGIKTKRFGYTLQGSPPGTAIRALTRGTELAAIVANLTANVTLSAFDPNATGTKWMDRPNMLVPACSSARRSIMNEQIIGLGPCDMASVNGVTVYCWIGGTGGLSSVLGWAMAVDEASGATLIPPTIVFNNGTGLKIIRCVVVGTKIVLAALTSTPSVRASVIDLTTVSSGSFSFAAETLITSDVGGGGAVMDLAPFDSTNCLLVWERAALTVGLAFVSSVPALGTNVTIAEAPAVFATAQGTSGENVYVAYNQAGVGLRCSVRSATNLTQVVAPFTVDAFVGPGLGVMNAGICRKDATSVYVVHTRNQGGAGKAGGVFRDQLKWESVTNAGTVSALGAHNDLTAISKPFVLGTLHTAVTLPSSNGASTFLLNLIDQYYATSLSNVNGALAGMAQYRAAGGTLGAYAAGGNLANVYTTGTTASFACLGAKKLATASFQLTNIERVDFNFSDAKRFAPVEIGGATTWAASISGWYDGARVIENQYLMVPEGFSGAQGNHGSAGLVDGTYIYFIIYEGVDANGNAFQSSLSQSLSVVVDHTGGGFAAGQGQITISSIPNNVLTLRGYGQGAGPFSKISIYRNAPSIDVSVFYKIKELIDIPGTAAQSYVDSASDATISVFQKLYTQGGTLEKEPPPPSSHMILHQNAVWGISSDDPYVVFYSGDYLQGIAPWFSSGFQIRADQGGPCTALASLDDKMIVFKADQIYQITGSRPNATGQGGSLFGPALISSDCGCVDWRSIVRGPAGIYFLSRKGIYLLDRGLNLSFVGAPVSAHTEGVTACASAKMLLDRREIRWEILSAATSPVSGANKAKLVYNYDQDEWTTHCNPANDATVDAAVGPGIPYSVMSSSVLYQESAGYYDPGSTYVVSNLTMGWLAPAGRTGLSRLQYLLFLGERKDHHKITLSLGYDYAAASASKVFPDANISALPSLPGEMLSWNVPRQQAASFQPSVVDGHDSDTTGQGCTFRALRLMAIPKRGSFEKFMSAISKG